MLSFGNVSMCSNIARSAKPFGWGIWKFWTGSGKIKVRCFQLSYIWILIKITLLVKTAWAEQYTLFFMGSLHPFSCKVQMLSQWTMQRLIFGERGFLLWNGIRGRKFTLIGTCIALEKKGRCVHLRFPRIGSCNTGIDVKWSKSSIGMADPSIRIQMVTIEYCPFSPPLCESKHALHLSICMPRLKLHCSYRGMSSKLKHQ